MPQLNFATFIGQIFWLAIFFSAVYAFIKSYFIPNISKTLLTRESTIANNIKKAETLVAESKQLENEVTQAMAKARDVALKTKQKAMDSAEAMVHSKMEEFEKELKQEFAKAEKEVATEAKKLKKELLESKGEIAGLMANKVMSSYQTTN